MLTVKKIKAKGYSIKSSIGKELWDDLGAPPTHQGVFTLTGKNYFFAQRCPGLTYEFSGLQVAEEQSVGSAPLIKFDLPDRPRYFQVWRVRLSLPDVAAYLEGRWHPDEGLKSITAYGLESIKQRTDAYRLMDGIQFINKFPSRIGRPPNSENDATLFWKEVDEAIAALRIEGSKVTYENIIAKMNISRSQFYANKRKWPKSSE